MSEPSVSSLIDCSWKKTKETLFPFQFKRWLKFVFVVWLAGQSFGINFPNSLRNPRETAPAKTQTQQAVTAGAPAAAEKPENEAVKFKEETEQVVSRLGPWLFVLIPALLALVIFLWWLSARFNFVLLEFLFDRNALIGPSFAKFKAHGNSYFLWSLGFFLIMIAVLLLSAGLIAVSALFKPLFILSIPLFIAALLVFALIGVLVSDFVVPIMYRDGTKAMDTFKRFFSSKPAAGKIAVYFLVKIGLGIAAAIAALVIYAIVAILAGVIFLIPVLLGAWLASAVAVLKPVLTVIGIILLVPAVLALFILLVMATLPISVFFRLFSIGYLVKFIPEYNFLQLPPETA